MDITRAKEILSALAEGIDPTTGEVLPQDSVCNKGEIVRALYAFLNNLNEKKSKKNTPENAGKPWSRKMMRFWLRFITQTLRKEIFVTRSNERPRPSQPGLFI